MRRGRAGAALLEAIVALAILAGAGVALVTLTTRTGAVVQRAREADREAREASAFLEAVALWPRDDLDRRLGERPQGRWRLRVDRPHPTLSVAVLTDSTGSREILRTSLYRPVPVDAMRR